MSQVSKESEQAFAAFVTYRDMGVERSTAKVGQRLGKSKTLMDRWSARYRWVKRAAAWDTEQDRIRQEAANKAVAKATEKAVYKREITAHRILEETANIAFSRLTDAMSWKDVPGLVDSDKLSDEAAAAIESVKITTDEDGNQRAELKFYNKQPALTKLGENKKLWGAKEEPTQTNNLFLAFIEAARSGEIERELERRRGLKPAELEDRVSDVVVES